MSGVSETDYQRLGSRVAAAIMDLQSQELVASNLYLPSRWFEIVKSEGEMLLGLRVVEDDEGMPRVGTSSLFGPEFSLLELPETSRAG